MLGDVGEGAVVIVVIERGERFSARAVAWPVHGIHEEDVLPAVVVVIENADAAAHCFGEILFAEGAGIVFEADAGLGGDVGEFDGAGGTW